MNWNMCSAAFSALFRLSAEASFFSKRGTYMERTSPMAFLQSIKPISASAMP